MLRYSTGEEGRDTMRIEGNRADGVRLAGDLELMLVPHMEGLAVTVGMNERWDRPCVTFTWVGFSDLLPEERFHRLVQLVPTDFRESRMAGLIWLELAPGESVGSFLELPRSEDVTGRVGQVYDDLTRHDFFESLGKGMGPHAEKNCGSDFTKAIDVLRGAQVSASLITEAKLVFILHGCYCDCQILQTVGPALAKLRVGAA